MSGYDAVLVGGRVAGAATALLLAREGLKVAIVERGRPGGDTVSTRDHLSHQLFDATEAMAAYDWDTPTVQRPLREVDASMSDELDHLNGLLGTGAVAAAAPS